ncbi:hypothetical protein BC834DRAFT_846695 [Gloeopeniophorella convolvens]|nr:hypothetical protein BC834DRAFT_846695 [Gloeopeniophorella convolvens]
MPGRPDFAEEGEEQQQQADGGHELEAAAAEEDGVLAEASHVATVGIDDTLDTELDVDTDADADADTDTDVADAQVDCITTAAQSRLRSCQHSGFEPARAQQGREKRQQREAREDDASASASESSVGRILGASTTPRSWRQLTDMTHGKFSPCASSPAWFLRCRTRRMDIIDLYKDMQRAVEDLATCLMCFLQIDRLNHQGHANFVWCAEFDCSADDGDLRRDALPSKRRRDEQRGEKFLEVSMMLKPAVYEIRIQNQVIFLDPPLGYTRQTWIQQLHHWLGGWILHALSSKLGANARYSHVGNAVQIIARNSLTTRCNGRSRSWRPRFEDYISKWLQFQSLRDLEAKYVFNCLGDLLAHLQRQLTGIKRVQARVNAKYDAWLRDILLRFSVKLAIGNAMKDIRAAIPEVRNGPEHHPVEGLVGGKRRFCSFGFRVSRPARPCFPISVLIQVLYALPFLPALSLASVAI